jgi:hypothetical protein
VSILHVPDYLILPFGRFSPGNFLASTGATKVTVQTAFRSE